MHVYLILLMQKRRRLRLLWNIEGRQAGCMGALLLKITSKVGPSAEQPYAGGNGCARVKLTRTQPSPIFTQPCLGLPNQLQAWLESDCVEMESATP
jgi:hypothetical protein